MPWESKTVKNLREEFCEEAQVTNNLSLLCRKYNISRQTGYKWLERYANGDDLADKSKAPLHTVNKIPPEVERQILAIRRENPGWGSRTILAVLENKGCEYLPCARTVNNVLLRNHCISPEESQKRQPFTRFEKDHCNDMWQTDFKGEFKLQDGNNCFPLTILDDHSRFSIMIKPALNTANLVIPAFKEAFEQYGMPDSVLSDNGSEFAGFKRGYSQFAKWLMCHDILPIHCRIRHPQTQGKIERFHGSMKRELLNHYDFANIDDANEALQQWRTKYNTIRPHEALNMACPADVYRPSERIYSDKIDEYPYSGEFHVVKVNSWGYVRFAGWQTYLSETMVGEYIEFRPNPLGDSFIACFRNFRIAEFSVVSGALLNRHIYRL